MCLSKRVKTNEYFTTNQLEFVLNKIDKTFIKSNKKIEYLNIPCCFDIEVSSYETAPSENRVGIMYGWTLSLDGYVILGRTWCEFISVIKNISIHFDLLAENRRVIIFVHNLSYEFQFIRKRFKWYKIFALEQREVVQAITDDGIEFRCSYKLSGYSLANLSKQLIKYKTEKMVGYLDYSLIRTPLTPLTKKEKSYMIHDVNVVVAYIQEIIEREKNISNIPLTKTGFVRRLCRHSCLYDKKDKKNTLKFIKYRKLMNELRLTEDTYTLLKKTYMGGYTHANALYVQEKLHDVGSFDLTSAYPAHMLTEYYPMSKFIQVKIKESNQLEKYLQTRCCILVIKFTNIKSKFIYENYLSLSKCYNVKNPNLNNGRIDSAQELVTYLTEQDYFIVKETYGWDEAEILDFYIADKGYLPTDLIKAMLQLYKNKTELKDVEGKETEYMQSKEYINSMYGMMVTDPLRDEILYDGQYWNKEKPNIKEALEKYNISKNRFLYYAWGVWITAYTRRTLWHAIQNLAEDYVYSDTDSVKFINKSNHLDFFKEYNDFILFKIKKACDFHKINVELCSPKTKKGKTKTIGLWDEEEPYEYFKTLGAKRYMYTKHNQLTITIAGVNKIKGSEYMNKTFGDKAFEAFDDNLYFPAEWTGKNTHVYQDEEMTGTVQDYLGQEYDYDEYSSIYMEPAEYSLSITQQFLDFIKGKKIILF